MEYFRIKNWDKYQKTKRNSVGQMDYLCLYTSTLDDPKIARMTLTQFAFWVRLLLVSRRTDNVIPLDKRWLSARVGVPGSHRRVDLQFLWDLGLVEAISKDSEERRGEDKRGEERNASLTLAEKPPLKIIKEEPKKNAAKAWADILEFKRRFGSQEDAKLPFDDSVKKILKELGGMRKIRLCTDADFPFLEIAFVKKFNELGVDA